MEVEVLSKPVLVKLQKREYKSNEYLLVVRVPAYVVQNYGTTFELLTDESNTVFVLVAKGSPLREKVKEALSKVLQLTPL